MFDFRVSSLSQTTPGSAQILTDAVFENVAAQTLEWLSQPQLDCDQLFTNLPALELALAASVKFRDVRYLNGVRAALAQCAENVERVKDANQAAQLLTLALHAYQLTGEDQYRNLAERGTHHIMAAFYNKEPSYFYNRSNARDAIFYSDANAWLGEGFYNAWRVLGDQELRAIAGDALGLVCDLFETGGGLRHRRAMPEGTPDGAAPLSDYASAIQLCLTAAETTARRTYLSRAMILAEDALAHAEALVSHVEDEIAFADALTRLHQFTGDEKYHDAAGARLEQYAQSYRERGIDAAAYALAVEHWLHFPLHIVIVGKREGEDTRSLLDCALRQYASARAVEVVDPTRVRARLEALGYAAASDGSAQAYICIGPVCLPPLTSVEQMSSALQRARRLT